MNHPAVIDACPLPGQESSLVLVVAPEVTKCNGVTAEDFPLWLSVTNRRYFLVMDELEDVLEDEVLILHCHENGDCQEPDDRHSERSRV